MKKETREIFEELFIRYPDLLPCKQDIESAFLLIKEAYQNDKKLLICGNGGSASDAEHIVGELMKNFKKHRKFDEKMLKALENEPELLNGLEPGLPAISLVSQTSLITAYLNDHDPNFIYAQQVSIYGKEGDILIAISTSGNSKNCVNAAKVAKALNLKVISLTGMKESELSKISDTTIKVPETETYKVQERHLPIYHTLCAMIEEELF